MKGIEPRIQRVLQIPSRANKRKVRYTMRLFKTSSEWTENHCPLSKNVLLG